MKLVSTCPGTALALLDQLGAKWRDAGARLVLVLSEHFGTSGADHLAPELDTSRRESQTGARLVRLGIHATNAAKS